MVSTPSRRTRGQPRKYPRLYELNPGESFVVAWHDHIGMPHPVLYAVYRERQKTGKLFRWIGDIRGLTIIRVR